MLRGRTIVGGMMTAGVLLASFIWGYTGRSDVNAELAETYITPTVPTETDFVAKPIFPSPVAPTIEVVEPTLEQIMEPTFEALVPTLTPKPTATPIPVYHSYMPLIQNPDANMELNSATNNLEMIVNDCLKAATERGIQKYGLREKEVESYIDKNMPVCLNSYNYSPQNIEINVSQANSNIFPNEGIVSLQFPINLTHTEQMQKIIENFSYQIGDFKDPLEGFKEIYRGVYYSDGVVPQASVVKADISCFDPDFDPNYNGPDCKFGLFMNPPAISNMTVWDLASQYGLEVAVNGPSHNNGYLTMYVKIGNQEYSADYFEKYGLTVTKKGVFLGNEEPNNILFKLGAMDKLVEDGQILKKLTSGPDYKPVFSKERPRTVIGISDCNLTYESQWSNEWLNNCNQPGYLIIAVFNGDGGFPGYTYQDVAKFVKKLGARNVIALDGGGSSQMFVDGYYTAGSLKEDRSMMGVLGIQGVPP